jgi:hypothetical protein
LHERGELALSRSTHLGLLFFDGDIKPLKGWYREITSHITKDVGAVAGLAIYLDSSMKKLIYLNMKDKHMEHRTVDKSNPDAMRGLTHDTLCRTEFVKGWLPPSILAAYEDHHLLRHVVQKGFKWGSISNAKVIHYGVFACRSEYKKGKWNGTGARLIRAKNLRKILTRLIYYTFGYTYDSLRIRDPTVIPISLS